MPRYGFPADDYTPHGYLANPHAVAHSWSDGEGGCLRSSRCHLGIGWQLPWALQAKASADLVIALECDGQRLVTRADFARCDLTSPHHTSQLLTYRWQAFGCDWDASFALIADGQLGLQVVWSSLPFTTGTQEPRTIRLTVGVVGWRRPDPGTSPRAVGTQVDLGEPFGAFQLRIGSALESGPGGSMAVIHSADAALDDSLTMAADQVAVSATFELGSGGEGTLSTVLLADTNNVDPGSVAVNVNDGLVVVMLPVGPPVIVVSGAAVSTVNVRVAGVASWLPAASLARTENV